MAGTLLTIAEARAEILKRVRALPTETVAIEAAAGRTLTAEIQAAGPVPPFPCSAMDGYAVNSGVPGHILAVAGESRAGHPSPLELGGPNAIRISTGAVVPPGADAVIRQEDVRRLPDGRIELLATPQPGANIRAAGEDMKAGRRMLTPGVQLGPAELGVLVGAGAGSVQVARCPKVTVLCTGDELRAPGEPLGPGEIHNSNGPVLRAMVSQAGGLAKVSRPVADDPRQTLEALAAALAQADVLIVCGGVSVGPHDHVRPALTELAVEEVFWRVALQPGKPMWFGTRGETLVFGLPGNPVSAVVTFALFVRAALDRLVGRVRAPGRPGRAALAHAVRRSLDREQAVRVSLTDGPNGALATPTGPQDSHLATSLIDADALAMIPAGRGELAAGSGVRLEALWD